MVNYHHLHVSYCVLLVYLVCVSIIINYYYAAPAIHALVYALCYYAGVMLSVISPSVGFL